MISMTGFGKGERSSSSFTIECEIKSVNSRFFECVISLPTEIKKEEEKIQKIVKSSFTRGHLDISFNITNKKATKSLFLNKSLFQNYLPTFSILKEDIPSLQIELDDLISLGIITEKDEEEIDYSKMLYLSLEDAIKALKEEKKREGEETRKNLLSLFASLKSSFNGVKSLESLMEEKFKNILKSKYDELTLSSENNPRFMEEVASLLVKYSINEEVERISSHINKVDELLSSPLCGKEMDFLLQEFNREVNTILSKSQDIKITEYSIKMKDNIENMREQVRNVE